jgi:5-oxoprolinase (ATP-hydrolysing)
LQLIGNQSRPKIFDLVIARPELLYEKVCEIDERVLLFKGGNDDTDDEKPQIIIGKSQDKFIIEKELDEIEVRSKLTEILADDTGIKTTA